MLRMSYKSDIQIMILSNDLSSSGRTSYRDLEVQTIQMFVEFRG